MPLTHTLGIAVHFNKFYSILFYSCLLIVTSAKFWRDVVWHDVATSRHTVSVLPFLELIVKIEFVVVDFM